MKRTLFAALLAVPLLAWAHPTFANPPKQCNYGYGCGGYCLGLFSKLHQHGPLYNYGPYYGYPPFEPYGPWNAYLQYNPYYYGSGGGGGHGHHQWFHCGCHSCGFHAHWAHGGWFHGHGCLTCGHHLFHRHGSSGSSCSTCGSPPVASAGTTPAKAVAFDPLADPVARYTGMGDVRQTAVFYAGLPTLDPNVVPAGN